MIAFKKGNFLDKKQLSREEAEEFIIFLERELERHSTQLELHRQLASNDTVSDIKRVISQTCVVRHLEDIKHTQATINYLRTKYEGI